MLLAAAVWHATAHLSAAVTVIAIVLAIVGVGPTVAALGVAVRQPSLR